MNGIIENSECTKLEDLPAEIFHLLFDYLTGDHVLKAFLCLNNRFNHLIKQVRLKTIDLSNWTRREITDFFKNSLYHVSSFSLSLKLTNQISNSNICSGNIEFIFSLLLDIHQLRDLLNHLQQLTFIRPIIDSTICLPDIILQSFLVYSFNDKIIFRKTPVEQRFDSVIICSNEMLRTVLTDNSQVSNQILINFQNPSLHTIIPFVRHLKLYIDHYQEQWTEMSVWLNSMNSELTLLICDNKFQYIHALLFSSFLTNLSDHCRLHFYLQFLPDQVVSRRDIDILHQNFQSNFFIQHHAIVTISYGRSYFTTTDCPLIIYTSPFPSSKLTLTNNQEMIGTCSDYTNLTHLVLDPCIPDYANMFTMNNQINFLSNLTSLEFLHTSWHRFNQILVSMNTIFRQISSRLRRIHFRSVECSAFLIKRILPLHTFPNLRYLDITDNDENCSILGDLIRQEQFCANIFHLNISGRCRLKISHIRDLSRTFTHLQTLKFSMKFDLSYNEQLNTIGQFLLIQMNVSLHYLHIHFEQENLLIMPMSPSESQLSEWLGHNQKRLMHVQAIELNRKELSAWM